MSNLCAIGVAVLVILCCDVVMLLAPPCNKPHLFIHAFTLSLLLSFLRSTFSYLTCTVGKAENGSWFDHVIEWHKECKVSEKNPLGD